MHTLWKVSMINQCALKAIAQDTAQNSTYLLHSVGLINESFSVIREDCIFELPIRSPSESNVISVPKTKREIILRNPYIKELT